MASGATLLGADSLDGSPGEVGGPRQNAPSSRGDYGEALLARARASLDTLRELMQHGDLLDAEVSSSVESAVRDVEQRLARAELCVVVLGAAGSGKRTFLDALVGESALGAALGTTRAIVTLRRRDAIDFRARLADNRVEQFSVSVPDRRAELDQVIEASARALEQAQANVATLEANIERATNESRRAADAWGEALATFEGKRLDTVQLGADLEAAGLKVDRVRRELEEAAHTVPAALRTRPPWWAVWSWLWRFLFVVLFSGRTQRYKQRAREHDAAIAALDSARQRADQNQHACRTLETELEPLGAAAEASRVEASDAEAAREPTAANLERARTALDNARAALELHVQERHAQFFARIDELARAGGGRLLREIEVDFPASLIPADVAVVDVPEMTDAAPADSARVLRLVREHADGCVLVSDLDQPVTSATKQVLQQLREIVPHVLLVLTKMDRVFIEATRRRNVQPWSDVEKARRAGTLRVARDIDRGPEEVFSLAVAARAALEDGDAGLARRFKSEVDKLFQLLRHERAIMLGRRSTGAVQNAIAGLGKVREAAVAKYGERLGDLESHRAPPPDAFKMDALAAAEPRVAEARAGALREASDAAHGALDALRVNCRSTLSRARGRKDVLDAARQTQAELDAGLPSAWAVAQMTLESAIAQRLGVMQKDLFFELRRRYRIREEVRKSQSSIPLIDAEDEQASQAVVLAAVEAASSKLGRVRLLASVGGAGVGALAARLVAPTLPGALVDVRIATLGGALVGLALGAAVAVLHAATRLRRQAIASLDSAIDQAEGRIAERLAESAGVVYQTIYDALSGSLDSVMDRFAEKITERLQTEAAMIAHERQALASLQRLGPALGEHDDRLFEAIEAAVEASVALCR